MTGRQILLFSLFGGLLAIGQILFKRAARSFAGQSGLDGFVSLFTSASFWSAIVLYGMSTLLWVWLLRDVPLNRAYPFAAVAFVLVPILSYLLLDEPITVPAMLGAAFIVVGIAIAQV